MPADWGKDDDPAQAAAAQSLQQILITCDLRRVRQWLRAHSAYP